MNTYSAKVITANGTIIEVHPKNGRTFTFAEIRLLINCQMVELIHPPSKTGALMAVDEDGKRLNKPTNNLASEMWMTGCDPGSARSRDCIVGDILLCHATQID